MVKAVLPDVGGTGSFPGGGTKIPPDMPSTCPPPKKKKQEDTGRVFGNHGAFLLAQMVTHPPAMQETQV